MAKKTKKDKRERSLAKTSKKDAKRLRKAALKLAKSEGTEVSTKALEQRAEELAAQLERKERKKGKGKKGKGSEGEPKRLFNYTQNREISWLRFDDRVLDEAFDETVPLFERLKFVSIFGSNLDEWFMVRIGGLSDLALLKHQPRDIRSNETPSEQIENAMAMLPSMIRKQASAFSAIEANLAGEGVTRVRPDDLSDADLRQIARHFDRSIAPIISPMIVDPRHPFPNLKNGRLYVACSLDGPEETGVLGIVEVPHRLERVIKLPSSARNFRYVLLEDAILSRLGDCFGDYIPTSKAIIRVTRNADVDPDGEGVVEEEDYRQHMKLVLKKRLRLQAVRLEIDGKLDGELLDFVMEALHLTPSHVFHTGMPLDLGYVFSLEGSIPGPSRSRLLEEPFEPQASPMVDPVKPMRAQVEDHDILLSYPYESMEPLLRLLREASSDTSCISIKVTLYRVAKQSRLCESLIAAVENGKEVTVLMELRARFDEANNIAWADRLENAGCTVIYGSEGFKCHSKICQITYHDHGEIRRITCLGTGNFNEKTARLYSDFMLLTAHEGIGEDGSTFFRNLSLGNLRGSYKFLGVAPVGLKPLVMRGLNHEIERARSGEDAQVFMKMNSLTDRDVIDKIAEACQAGVRVIMIIRGICCIKANIEGYTDGLIVRQIVGRFLEHARIYAFGPDASNLYLSSADMMTRNTEHRVEIAYPVLDETCRDLVVQFVNLQLADNTKARRLTSEGTWEKVVPALSEPTIISQELLLSRAYQRASGSMSTEDNVTPSSHINPRLSAEEIRRIVSIPSLDMNVEVVEQADDVPLPTPPSEEAPTQVDAPEEREEAKEPAPKPAKKERKAAPAKAETTHVEARIIEDVVAQIEEEETAQAQETPEEPEEPQKRTAPTPEEDSTSSSTSSNTSIEPRRPGRLAVAFKLIGMGVKELFTGSITRKGSRGSRRG